MKIKRVIFVLPNVGFENGRAENNTSGSSGVLLSHLHCSGKCLAPLVHVLSQQDLVMRVNAGLNINQVVNDATRTVKFGIRPDNVYGIKKGRIIRPAGDPVYQQML
jgi:hypothetical protein